MTYSINNYRINNNDIFCQYIFNVKNIQNDSWVYALLYNIIKDSKSTNPIVWTLGHSAYIIAL